MASRVGSHSAIRLLRSAKWRKEPATAAQKALVAIRYRSHVEENQGTNGKPNSFAPEDLTKGQAANMITRLKHGAQVGARNLLEGKTADY